ncbi:MAG: isochorismatase family protein [Hyphomicrobiaceae bacterium]
MPPLLKPSECSVLVLDSAGELRIQDQHANVRVSRDRILQAASLCAIPTFRAGREQQQAVVHDGALSNQPIYSPPMPGNSWAETPLGLALAQASRTSLLICGYWLDECVTFTALNALGEGYDIFLLTDASPPLDEGERHMAILRLVQAGIVPTTTRQALREWAAEIADVQQRDQLLGLI